MDSFLGILEIIGYIFLFIIVYGYVIPLIANLMKGSAKAAVKKVKGEDVDWKKEVLGIQRFEIRQRIEKLGDDGLIYEYYESIRH